MELKSNITYAEFVKPGDKLEKAMGQVAGIKFSKKDFVVLISGSNDVYDNEEESVFRNLKNTVLHFRPAKVVLAGIPFRQDLPLFHRINESIMNLNIHIYEMCRILKHIVFVDMTAMSGRCFNRDGVHLNNIGEEFLTDRI